MKRLQTLTLLLFIALYAMAQKSESEVYKEFNKQAIADKGKKNYKKVVRDCLLAIHNDPENPFAYMHYGEANYYLSLYANSIWGFETLHELHPRSASACYNVAGVYADMGYDKKAMEFFDRALELKSKNSILFNNRSIIFFNNGKLDKALADLDLSYSLKKDDNNGMNIFYNKAIVYNLMAMQDSALYYCDKAIEGNDKNSELFTYKALILKLMENPEYRKVSQSAINLLLGELKNISNNYSSYYDIAQMYDLQGNEKDAEKNYQTALKLLNTQVELFPYSYPMVMKRGLIYERLGNKAAAETDFAKVKELNPEYTAFYLRTRNFYLSKR